MSQYLSLIKEIWPKNDIGKLLLESFEGDLSGCKLDYGQVKEILLHEAKVAKFKKNPDTAEILKHIQKVRHAQFAARAAEKSPDGPDFIEQQRRIQAKGNPAANSQPRWRILAAWFDQEFTSRSVELEARFDAGVWVAHALMTEGAGYNDAVYAAAKIYDVDAAALDARIQNNKLVCANERIRNSRIVRSLLAKAEAERVKRLAVVA